jgi:hypothetical protein
MLYLQTFKVGAANLLWFLYAASKSRKWQRATLDVAGTQQRVLKRILSNNTATEFGRDHRFAQITSVEMYRQAVPLRIYEEFKPYIERIVAGQPQVLTSKPVQQFVLTSGSTQAAKLVPYTKTLVNEFQEGIDPWVNYLFRSCPRLLTGKTYWSVTPVGERKGHTSAGIPLGFDDEKRYFSPLTRWVLNSIMTVPSAVAQLQDIETFCYVTLSLLLQEPALSWVSVWNPSFLTLLLEKLSTQLPQLTEDIRCGTLSVAEQIEPSLRKALLPLYKKNPARAQELSTLHKAWQGKPFTATNTSGETLYEAIWPNMRLISCWAHGNAARALPHLQAHFPHAIIQPKGLLATEAFVSFPFIEDVSALSLRSHFFEFADVNDPMGTIKLAHELQLGRRYAVIVTTGAGLYRYRLNDVIEVTGFYHECPLIRFIGRQAKVVDICGEKLNEDHICTIITDILATYSLSTTFWMLAPEWPDEGRPCYTLFIQFASGAMPDKYQPGNIALEIDNAMKESYHYEYCRRLGQLDCCRLFIITPESDAFHIYLTVCTELGQRLGDIKPTALHAYQGWSGRFSGRFVGNL